MASNAELSTPTGLLRSFTGAISLTALLASAAVLINTHAMAAVAAFLAASTAYEILGFIARRRATTMATARYEFGIGKLQQGFNLLLALAMIAACAWLVTRLDAAVSGTGPAVARYHVLLTTILSAICTLRFASEWLASFFSIRRGAEGASRGGHRSATIRFVIMSFVQAALTLAAVTQDPLTAVWAQASATGAIALALMLSGINMVWNAILDLIDHPLDSQAHAAILQHIERGQFEAERIEDIRTRRAAAQLFVELTVHAAPVRPLPETLQELASLKHHLASGLTNADVTVKLA